MPDQLFFDIVKMVVALACIVGLIFFVVWLLKQFLPGTVRRPYQRVELGVVSQISLGSRQRLLVVRVAERTLVLGVTEASITTLAELQTPLPAPADQKEADDPRIFADLLSWPKDSLVASKAPSGAPSGEPAAAPASVEDEGPRLFAPGERNTR
ncbi:MAG: flagellar biosynthetic protein FliO [Proteobacteria bacterium]|nr:flagellar biosynthetic protein FliO [Pseudomonadota bacterium]MBU1594936.1 flagellar biosynthetic protein FliO [Pseudomonadota bacterium]